MRKDIVIIGLDALEADLVEEFDIDSLKQEDHGRIDLSPALLPGDNPVSPTMWTSFMTGKGPEDHGVEGFEWDTWLPIEWIYKIWTPEIGLEDAVLKRLGLEKDFPDEDKIQEKTFIDHLRTRIDTVNAPIYDFNFSRKGERVGTSDQEDVGLEQLKEDLLKHSKLVHEEVLERVEGRWDVFFCYYYWLDGLQHNFYMDRELLEREYEKAGDYVEEIKERVPNDTIVLVVSDHGADLRGGHSDYGFWSCSEEGLIPEDVQITDFYNIVMRISDLPGRDDEERIRERLEDLGYM